MRKDLPLNYNMKALYPINTNLEERIYVDANGMGSLLSLSVFGVDWRFGPYISGLHPVYLYS